MTSSWWNISRMPTKELYYLGTMFVFMCLCVAPSVVSAQVVRLSVREEQPAGTVVGSLADDPYIVDAVSPDVLPSLRLV